MVSEHLGLSSTAWQELEVQTSRSVHVGLFLHHANTILVGAAHLLARPAAGLEQTPDRYVGSQV